MADGGTAPTLTDHWARLPAAPPRQSTGLLIRAPGERCGKASALDGDGVTHPTCTPRTISRGVVDGAMSCNYGSICQQLSFAIWPSTASAAVY